MFPPDKLIIHTDQAPAAIGPYSQGVRVGPFLFTAGQTALNPPTGELVPGGIEAETRQVLENVKNVLAAAGSSMAEVVKTTVFLRDMNDFGKMNAIYAQYFPDNPPARTTVQVVALPKGGAVEIEVVAIVKE